VATYYQEVLRARARVLSADEALLTLARSMRSAADEGTGRVLSEESRAMQQTFAYRSVYWAGAAYFLVADVELRRRSHGQRSLDSVLAELRKQDSSLPSSLDAVLARMDELAGMAVFRPLADTCLARTFPEIEPTLTALGVQRPGEPPTVASDAPLAAVRAQLFAPQPAVLLTP
jgi:predicted metalloprotease with PDZ domain